MFRLLTISILALLLPAFPMAAADGGWLVYELHFTPQVDENVNFEFYSGAYLIAPVTGGAGSMILTTQEGGAVYAVSDQSVRVFTAANPQVQRTVFAALALNGTAQATYNASGVVDQTVSLPGDKGLSSYQAASVLRGRLIATDDDSELEALPEDGRIGMIGFALLEGGLRQDLSYNASQHDTLEKAVLYLTGLLEQYGYTEEGRQATEGTATPAAADETTQPATADNTDASLFPAGSAHSADDGHPHSDQ